MKRFYSLVVCPFRQAATNFSIPLLVSFTLLCTAFAGGDAHAITIDDLKDPNPKQSVSADPGFPAVSNKATTHAIGGARKLYAEVTSGVLSVRATQQLGGAEGNFTHSSDTGTNGQTRIVWDGEVQSPGVITVKYNGLRAFNGPVGVGIDLTEDGGTKFILNKTTRDLPSAAGATITMNVYDASSPTKICARTISLNTGLENTEITRELVFTDFTAPSGAVTCNPATLFTNVGAIELIVLGVNALDFSMSSVVTDGVCPTLIPANGPNTTPNGPYYILDSCGVCGGNNSKCKDCDGNIVPNSTIHNPTFTEHPGVGGQVCDTGQYGVCMGGIYYLDKPATDTVGPVCECRRQVDPTPEVCDGVDNNCNDEIDEVTDVCGVKCGDSSTCKDCAGVPNGGKVVDACGICGGDGKSCLDCAGVPNGGKKVDVCGICGGDGTSCTSSCTKTVITETLFELDAQAKVQEKVIIRGVRPLQNDPAARKFAPALKVLLKKAHDLQIANWILSWTLPEIIVACENDIVCFQSSNVDKLTTYRTNAKSLLALNSQVSRYYRRLGRAGRAKVQDRNGNDVYQHALELAASVPESTSVCNIATSPALR